MKKIFKYLLVILVILPMLNSCETTEMELLASPNSLSEDQADPNFLYHSVQEDYVAAINSFNNLGSELSRIDQFYGRNYAEALTSGELSFAWSKLYSGVIPDANAIKNLDGGQNDLSYLVATTDILKAHLFMLMVDYIGDVPFSEAGNPIEFPSPKLDSSADVYQGAIAMLDNAITLLTNSAGVGSATDLFYGGNATKWVKLANTLKMRANLTQGNYADFLTATNIIDSTADDFQFKYGTNVLNPDTRHPYYANDYTSSGANDYLSNWLMNLMVGDLSTGDIRTDPRRRYYFYRQTWRVPNNSAMFQDVNGVFGPAGAVYVSTSTSGDAQTISCSVENTPSHFQFTADENIWCTLPYGYWGRMHGNNEGTPPDNFLRTAHGVYPAGGSFDGRSDAFPYVGDSPNATWGQKVALGAGGGGAGIQPIVLASYVQFWLAEANLALGNNGAASANLQNAITMSVDKVMTFSSLDPSADLTNVPDAAAISVFNAVIVNDFNTAPASTALDGFGYPVAKDKLDVLGEQFFVAMYGGGADAYNFIRRTGHPRTLARNIDPNPGDFPRSILYPNSETSANPNVSQKSDLLQRTFWDNGVVNPAN